ncbi:MAG: hypothetical protein AAF600_05325 [Bacteroidota bacterium]
MKTIKIYWSLAFLVLSTLSYGQGNMVEIAYDFNTNYKDVGQFIVRDNSSTPKLIIKGGIKNDNDQIVPPYLGFYAPTTFHSKAIFNSNVGIATASPNEKLEVNGNIKSDDRIYTIKNGVRTQMGRNSNNSAGAIGTVSNHDLLLSTNNSARMYIKADGNIGIGMSNPVERLDVDGGVRSDVVKSNKLESKENGYTVFTIEENTEPTGVIRNEVNFLYDLVIKSNDNTDKAGISWQNSGGNYMFNLYRKDIGGNKADIYFATGASNDVEDLNDVMVLTNSGKLGLGVTADLIVDGTIATINGAVHISPENGTPVAFDVDEYLADFLLWVEQGIVSEDIAIADKGNWDDTPDFVFESAYELPSLVEMKDFVKKHKHLPYVPGVEQIKKENHYKVHDMLMGQLRNMEELLLHTIAQEEKLEAQEKLNQELLKRLSILEKKMQN